MNETIEIVMLWSLPLLAVGIWYIVTTVLRKMARMEKQLPFELGLELRTSSRGSASINGVACNNIVKLREHDEGYLIQIMWLFGGGKLWIPKSQLKVGELKAGGFFSSRSRVLTSEMNRVVLYGKLADFMQESVGA